jgi:putative membrane protein
LLLLPSTLSVVPAITLKILSAAVVGAFAVISYDGYLGDEFKNVVDYSFTPFTALGVAISLFLGFHNNASYARWWEARTLWGTQIIAVRNLIRFLLGICQHDDDDDESLLKDSDWRRRIILLAMAQTHALRSQLRPSCKSDEIPAFQDRDRFLENELSSCIEQIVKSQNPASAILMRASQILGKESGLSTYSLIHASTLIDRVSDIQTSCERIHNTTLPFAYSLLVHRTSFMFVYLSPFAIASSMGWWTPVFTAILAYTLFGLDEVARQCNEPFRDEPQCLALSSMCRAVERDVCEALRREVPPTLKPVDSVLM